MERNEVYSLSLYIYIHAHSEDTYFHRYFMTCSYGYLRHHGGKDESIGPNWALSEGW